MTTFQTATSDLDPTTIANNAQTTVLVTGGGGFIGSHCIHQLLKQGYTVRTTVRSLKREAAIRSLVLGSPSSANPNTTTSLSTTTTTTTTSTNPTAATDRLSFVIADLTSDAGWPAAVKGCKYILHVASPFPLTSPKDENELIIPAVEGTLRVLRAARAESSIKRVVLTSSFAAIGYGHSGGPHGKKARSMTMLDEAVWSGTGVDSGIGAYAKSKTLAEKAAWDFVNSSASGNTDHDNGNGNGNGNGKLELSVINPVAVFGPVLGAEAGRDLGSSVSIISRIASGGMPAAPRLAFGVVDVRDVGALHIIAMTHPKAAGERFLAFSNGGQELYLREIAEACGKSVWVLPDWVVKAGSYVSGDLAMLANELGDKKQSSNRKARTVLGYEFIE